MKGLSAYLYCIFNPNKSVHLVQTNCAKSGITVFSTIYDSACWNDASSPVADTVHLQRCSVCLSVCLNLCNSSAAPGIFTRRDARNTDAIVGRCPYCTPSFPPSLRARLFLSDIKATPSPYQTNNLSGRQRVKLIPPPPHQGETLI